MDTGWVDDRTAMSTIHSKEVGFTLEQEVTFRMSHIGICVSNLDLSMKFYCNGLGFEEAGRYQAGREADSALDLQDVDLTGVFLNRDGVTIELLYYSSPLAKGSAARRPIEVDDVDAVKQRITEFGGHEYENTRLLGDGYEVIFCADPDGTRVELARYF